MSAPAPRKTLLEVRGLRTGFDVEGRTAKAVDGVDFDIRENEVFGLVGESGCGKSVTALSILRLIPDPPGKIVEGSIRFRGNHLLGLSWEDMHRIRGRDISMVFQEPMTALNPVFTIGFQLREAIRHHERMSKEDADVRAAQMLELVGIPDGAKRLKNFPHQMSGGMRQRVMIAMALACGPRLLIADEPTTALDVTIQAQILELMRELREETGASIILITHDLGVVAELAHRVVVMYAGRKVEEAPVEELFARPRHPYTCGLLASMPHLGDSVDETGKRLVEIPGMVPSLKEPLPGCLFAPRCERASERCRADVPALESHGEAHLVACWHPVAVPAPRSRPDEGRADGSAAGAAPGRPA